MAPAVGLRSASSTSFVASRVKVPGGSSATIDGPSSS